MEELQRKGKREAVKGWIEVEREGRGETVRFQRLEVVERVGSLVVPSISVVSSLL